MPLTGKSAGVSSTEIDLTFASPASPTGVPAGVIGTAQEGPAFVPVTVGSYQEFVNRFGPSNGEIFGPLAAREWLTRSQALTYIRVLGCGDGKQRAADGTVTNAGFIVGDRQIQESGIVGANPYAASGGPLGRTYFLGCYMSESAGSTIFSSAGIQGVHTASAIIRGVLMMPSGVVPALSASAQTFTYAYNNTPIGMTVESGQGHAVEPPTLVAGNEGVSGFPQRGDLTGTVNLADSKQEFVLLLNGHLDNPDENYRSFITASFDPGAGNYISKVLNKDPLKYEERGHLLYSHFDIDAGLAVVTGSGILNGSSQGLGRDGSEQPIAFLTYSTLDRNTGNATTTPDYEGFRDRYAAARTPFFTSQKFGSNVKNLFRVHARTDGSVPNSLYKVSIQNLTMPTDATVPATFDLVVRSFEDTDATRTVLESYAGLSLDPSDDRYIARIIGDQNTFFDFDKATRAQRLVVDGDYPNASTRIRVEMAPEVTLGKVPVTALPMGFRGPDHIITSGSLAVMSGANSNSTYLVANGRDVRDSQDTINRASVPPLSYRENIYTGLEPTKVLDPRLHWGIQFEAKSDPTQPNRLGNLRDDLHSRTKYFARMQTSNINFVEGNNAGVADLNGIVRDSDKFNHSGFSLSKIRVRTGSDGLADVNEWLSASYVRNGVIEAITDGRAGSGFTRAFKADDLKTPGNRKFARFTTIMQGGFDGTRIFNKDAGKLTDAAAKREVDDSASQGGISGPTVAAYRKAVDIMGNTSDVDIKLLAIPGIRDTAVTDFAISSVESRFDTLYIMDIEERDVLNTVVTSSTQTVDVTYTVQDFNNRGLNTSFAAAYFPDLVMVDPETKSNIQVPPSVGVLGAFGLNDSVGHPWFAPAGFSRGALNNMLFATVDLSRDNLDDLYDSDINPLTDFPGQPLVVWGQKTLLQAATSLDRVNVRRLLIEVRRSVRAIANSLLFEPNREETLARFSDLVNPIMQSIQELSGVDRYKVIIDTSTTTQADVENNTIRGKIFLQPTRTAEFISLDFVLSNAGSDAFDNV
jgi:hypothetical protein